ncbi:MAG: NuoM family protein [Candidatus Dormibacteria bacterium]
MILVVLLLAPVLAALATFRAQRQYVKPVAVAGTAVSLALSIVAVVSAMSGTPLHASAPWAPAAGLTFRLGADGVSSVLLLLNASIALLALLATRTERLRRPHLFVAMLLLAQVGAAGVLLAQDLVLFFLFWETVLVPFMVLISVFGEGQRERAALKLLIYTAVGSLPMLVSIASLFALSGAHSFLINDLASAGGGATVMFGFSAAQLAFLGFTLAFAIKAPLFPFHGWMSDAYMACPTPALMMLAGVVSKLGPYGFYRVAIRLLPGPARQFSGLLMVLAAIGIVYGALLAVRQTDVKRTVVYLSLSHMSFITLGIVSLTTIGLAGASLQMLNHGILIAAMFYISGHLEGRLGTRDRGRIAGLASRAPLFGAVFMVISLAILGLPGLNGFVGEYLIMAGTYARSAWVLLPAATGVVLAAWYTLRLYQGVMNGSDDRAPEAGSVELGNRELGVLLPLVVAAVAIGVYPGPWVAAVGHGVDHLSRIIAGAGG